jgi:hypothetical protein
VTIAGFKAAYNQWHNLAIQVLDNKVTTFLDGVMLAAYTDSKQRLSGGSIWPAAATSPSSTT